MSYDPRSYWQDRYKGELSLQSSGHRDLPAAYNLWLYKRKRQVLSKALRQIGRPIAGARVLEIGVGTGAYVEFFRAERASRFVGTDITPQTIGLLKQKFPGVELLECDVTQPGLKDLVGEFDIVVALDVLYHIVDDRLLRTALRNISEVLAPGGVFAIHDQFLHRPTEDHGYIKWRSLKDWAELLESSNLAMVERRPIFFTMIQASDAASQGEAALLDALWAHMNPLRVRLPALAGAASFALDSALGFWRREGPSMELALVRKHHEAKPT